MQLMQVTERLWGAKPQHRPKVLEARLSAETPFKAQECTCMMLTIDAPSLTAENEGARKLCPVCHVA